LRENFKFKIDFTGYGASTLLLGGWAFRHQSLKPVPSSVWWYGRTGHEVIQVKSVVYPWGIRVGAGPLPCLLEQVQDLYTTERWMAAWIGRTFDFRPINTRIWPIHGQYYYQWNHFPEGRKNSI
jgi:hypothetical protein